MRTLLFTLTLLVSGIATANIIPLKKGDTAVAENPSSPGLYQEVYVMYVEKGLARIRGKASTSSDFFDELWLATVPVESLIHPVTALGEFQKGDRVCLNKKIKSFRKGFCSKIYAIFENGNVTLWNGVFTSSVFVSVSDIEHKVQ